MGECIECDTEHNHGHVTLAELNQALDCCLDRVGIAKQATQSDFEGFVVVEPQVAFCDRAGELGLEPVVGCAHKMQSALDHLELVALVGAWVGGKGKFHPLNPLIQLGGVGGIELPRPRDIDLGIAATFNNRDRRGRKSPA